MIDKINLSNVKKCDQVWDEMPQTEGGRLCQKCQNTIVDFRGLSDKEVAHIHAFSEGPVCGLYYKKQLQPPVKAKSRGQLIRWQAVGVGLFGLLSVTSLSGQTTPKSPMVEQTDDKYAYRGYRVDFDRKEQRVDSLAGHIIISGRLMDTDSTPIIWGTIALKDHKKGTYSEAAGYYSLDLTELFETHDSLKLTYSFIGYIDKTVILLKQEMQKGIKKEINVVLDESPMRVSEFYVTRYSLHKRIWWKIKSLFKRKRK